MSDRKRANVLGDGDREGSPRDAKKPRANAPFAPSFLPTPLSAALPPRPAGSPSPAASGPAIDIAAKRAEIQAKLAAMKAAAAGGARPAAPAAPSAPAPSAPPSAALPQRPLGGAPGASTPNIDGGLAAKIAEAKRKVAEMAARNQAAQQEKVNPYLSSSFNKSQADPAVDPSAGGRGGLSMAAHPLLMDLGTPSAAAPSSKKDRYKPMAPKFSTTRANARMPAPPARPAPTISSTTDATGDALKESEFFDERLGYGSVGVVGKSHMGKGRQRTTFAFKRPGAFVEKGEAIRAEARLEDLKRRIYESSQKAGLQSDLEDTAKKVRRPPPPDVEWWDEGFLPDKDYGTYSTEFLDRSPLITHLVQHPISIPAPQDKIQVEAKPLFLTKKELKKKRRLRRQADMQDKRDRQKMGLLPPDPPKVKISNMMRVLTQEAIADPTKVEAQVRREMVARERKHLKENAERALTADEKRDKRELEYAKDEAQGLHAAAFKVRYLSDPSHKFKVKKNAIDLHLTGRICHNPKFCLVVVEGGAKSIKKYRQLMLNRIRWTEEAAPRARDDPEADEGPKLEDHGGILRPVGPFTAPDEPEAPASLADNTCIEVWGGAEREHLFGDLRNANCPSEASAREVLGKLGYLWDNRIELFPKGLQYLSSSSRNRAELFPDGVQYLSSSSRNRAELFPDGVQYLSSSSRNRAELFPDGVQYLSSSSRNRIELFPDGVQYLSSSSRNRIELFPDGVQYLSSSSRNRIELFPDGVQYLSSSSRNRAELFPDGVQYLSSSSRNRAELFPDGVQYLSSSSRVRPEEGGDVGAGEEERA